MGHEEDATDTAQLTNRSATREGISGKDVKWKMGFVVIHAGEWDVRVGAWDGGTTSSPGPLYTVLPLDKCGHHHAPKR
jgi:hypothetical protein